MTDRFFPQGLQGGGGVSSQEVKLTKAICDGCEYREPCLEVGLSLDVSRDCGIWGGTTPRERRTIRAQRRRGVGRSAA